MAELVYDKTGRLLFTKEMKEEYTLLVPQMLPMHFAMLVRVIQTMGYKVEMLNTSGKSIVDYGQKYVHNDACYPAILVIGQLIDAVKSGKYDPHKVALVITRLPGFQLHPYAQESPGKGRPCLCSRDLGEYVRPGKKPGLYPHPSLYPQGPLRRVLRRPHHERIQSGPPL